MSLKLWYSPASPFVRKVMVFAHETGLAGSITLGCALGYLDFRMPQIAWREGRATLGLWYEPFAQRKSMQATIPHA